MQKTVKELIEMLDSGELNTNQSTQRSFIYNDITAQLDGGEVTKAGAVINSIIEQNIQLPALYIWHNTDTGMTNLLDGKQRLLSIYNFIKPNANIRVCTRLNGNEIQYIALSDSDKQKLLNYVFYIVEMTGNSVEEEKHFYLINTNSIPLTTYECVRGMFYGNFIEGFENFINSKSKMLDSVKPVGRGEQAYKFLLAAFSLIDDKKSAYNSKTDIRLRDSIRPLRNNEFCANNFMLNDILETFNDLMRCIKGLKEDRALSIACKIIRNKLNTIKIVNAYREVCSSINDVAKWDMFTHSTFIDSLIRGITLDGRRFFTKDDKDALYRKSSRCAYVDPITGSRCTENRYDKLEVDHITPWSKGGRTTLDNAQLLCKSHNTSKGNRG